MKAHQAEYPIATQCRVLGVSTSGYYAWLKRAPSARSKANAELLEEIKKSHKKSDGTYGAPRIHADLPKEMGASLNRVARVMCDVGIQGVTRRKWTKTTVRDEDERAAPDLVDRDFTATGPDQLWVADITYIPTWAGFLYLAVVMDVWSRRIVGWAMATHLRTELVLDALNMALRQRRPEAVVHHSDQGSQPRFKGSSQQHGVEGLIDPVLRDDKLASVTKSSQKAFHMSPNPRESEATEGRRRQEPPYWWSRQRAG